jgi:hypothetical protein
MFNALFWDKFYNYFISRFASVIFKRLVGIIEVKLLLFWPSAGLRMFGRNQDLQTLGQYINHYNNIIRQEQIKMANGRSVQIHLDNCQTTLVK